MLIVRTQTKIKVFSFLLFFFTILLFYYYYYCIGLISFFLEHKDIHFVLSIANCQNDNRDMFRLKIERIKEAGNNYQNPGRDEG